MADLKVGELVIFNDGQKEYPAVLVEKQGDKWNLHAFIGNNVAGYREPVDYDEKGGGDTFRKA